MESVSEEDEGGMQDCARDVALAASEEALPAVIAQQEVAVEETIAAQEAKWKQIFEQIGEARQLADYQVPHHNKKGEAQQNLQMAEVGSKKV